MRRFLLVVAAVLPLAAATTACGDNLGLGDPIIFRDSVSVFSAPDAGNTLPTAVDLRQLTPRHPERLADAEQWDFALRQEGSTFRLVPSPFAIGSQRPLIGRSATPFAQIERAPTARNVYGDTAVTLTEGATFVARSRHEQLPTGGSCFTYAKILVKSLNPAEHTARFDMIANVGCSDDRLVAD